MTNLNTIISKNVQARNTLGLLVPELQDAQSQNNSYVLEGNLNNPDVILTPNEVNLRHGTGVIIRNIFHQSSNILSLRFHNHYDGEQDFGDLSLCLSLDNCSRSDVFRELIKLFNGSHPKRILCVVYSSQEVMAAIALKDIFNVPLCTYIMDDNNLFTSGENTIDYGLMEELLQKSSLRLAISPELRIAYEKQYGLKFWLLPPVIAPHLITNTLNPTPGGGDTITRGILVGNIWNQQYLDFLRQTVRGTGIIIDWYCNNYHNPSWLTINKEELAQEGILMHPPLPESDLSETLKNYKFAVIPSGKLDDNDQIQNIARLSLPTRIPFTLSTSNTPFLVLGSKSTAAARFVQRFGVGMVCDYEPSAFQKTVDILVSPPQQAIMRQNAVSIAQKFSSKGIAQWLWESLEAGQPVDREFERLMPLQPEDFAYYIDPPPPSDVWRDFIPVYQSLNRLKEQGFDPNFVIDVGASTGIWSDVVSKVFNQARFILIDPLFSKYDSGAIDYYINRHDNFEIVESMVSNRPGIGSVSVTDDLYNSSMCGVGNAEVIEIISSEIITLDLLLEQKALQGQGLLKLDVQFAEHLAIEGGLNLLKIIDVCVIEISLWKTNEDTKSLIEMLAIMSDLGFRFYDDAGYWRLPQTGTLFQKDIVFVKKNLYLEPGQIP